MRQKIPKDIYDRKHLPCVLTGDMVAEGYVKTNYHDDVVSCSLFKPKALSALNFLSRMGVCASAILCLCTVFQVHLAVTVAFGCSAVAFWQLWKWLEGKKAL